MSKQCPNCACDITDAEEYCPACGGKVDNMVIDDARLDNKVQHTVTEFTYSALTIKCQHCKQEFHYHKGDEATCPNCGYPFDVKKLEEVYKEVQKIVDLNADDGSIKFRKFDSSFGKAYVSKTVLKENEVIDYQPSMQGFEPNDLERHRGRRRLPTWISVIIALIIILIYVFIMTRGFTI